MKALVAFGTRYGSTARTASAIAEELIAKGYQVDVWDLRDRAERDLEGYDLIVLGSGIVIGKWSKEAQTLLATQTAVLARKRVALFAACSDVLYPEKVEAARKAYLEDVAAGVPGLRPVALGLFGGEVDFAKYGMLTKVLLKRVGAKKKLLSALTEIEKIGDVRDLTALAVK